MKALLLRLRGFIAEVWREGYWVYAPPMVIPGFSPIWRSAPPPEIRALPAPEPAPGAVQRTDPQLVAARRASLRLVARTTEA